MNSARAILDGDISSMAIALLLQRRYEATSVNISLTSDDLFQEVSFNERWSEEDKLKRITDRKRTRRTLSVFSGGMVASDYAHVTGEMSTLVRLGPWGESTEILRTLCDEYGGYLQESDLADGDEWSRIDRRKVDAGQPACVTVGDQLATA